MNRQACDNDDANTGTWTMREFNFHWTESIIIFAQWKQATEC